MFANYLFVAVAGVLVAGGHDEHPLGWDVHLHLQHSLRGQTPGGGGHLDTRHQAGAAAGQHRITIFFSLFVFGFTHIVSS